MDPIAAPTITRDAAAIVKLKLSARSVSHACMAIAIHKRTECSRMSAKLPPLFPDHLEIREVHQVDEVNGGNEDDRRLSAPQMQQFGEFVARATSP